MSKNDRMNSADSRKTRGNAKLAGPMLLGVTVLLSAWIAVAYFHVSHLQQSIADIIALNGSVLRVTLIGALGGFILSVPIVRSLSRKEKTSQTKGQPIPQFLSPRVHPLFTTSRPARDTTFVIRKTKNRGRISRNRGGERLPPTLQE
jgi:hypothetical protein